jgi:hypothetical protein
VDDVILSSEIPEGHSRKEVIEGEVREIFRSLPGSWRVAIRRAQPWADCWGFVIVDGPRRLRRVLPVDGVDDIRPRVGREFGWSGQ